MTPEKARRTLSPDYSKLPDYLLQQDWKDYMPDTYDFWKFVEPDEIIDAVSDQLIKRAVTDRKSTQTLYLADRRSLSFEIDYTQPISDKELTAFASNFRIEDDHFLKEIICGPLATVFEEYYFKSTRYKTQAPDILALRGKQLLESDVSDLYWLARWTRTKTKDERYATVEEMFKMGLRPPRFI